MSQEEKLAAARASTLCPLCKKSKPLGADLCEHCSKGVATALDPSMTDLHRAAYLFRKLVDRDLGDAKYPLKHLDEYLAKNHGIGPHTANQKSMAEIADILEGDWQRKLYPPDDPRVNVTINLPPEAVVLGHPNNLVLGTTWSQAGLMAMSPEGREATFARTRAWLEKLASKDKLPTPGATAPAPERPAEAPAGTVQTSPGGATVEQYVTLDQMAAIVNRSKRTLERLKTRRYNPLPDPAVGGGGGKPDEWIWSQVRLWLSKEYARALPEKYPPRHI
jgi:hypothetical protein